MTFNEFLNCELELKEVILDYYLTYLNEFSSKEFPYDELLKLNGAAEKFLNCIEKTNFISKAEREDYLYLIEQFRTDLKRYRHTKNMSKISLLITNKRLGKIRIEDDFEELFSKTIGLINKTTRYNGYVDSLTLNGFYQPANSNKKKIQDLINEAIILIGDDETLTEKSKKQLIDYLNKTLAELQKENVNWSKLIGRIKETIIVLGALGSFASGMTPLIQAKEKLEETTVVIQNTSINLNYNVLNETFNIKNIQQIGEMSSVVLQIQENNEKNN